MMPNIVRGGSIRGLTSYLAGEGRANEHVNQRVITGSPIVDFVYGGQPLSHDGALELGRDLDLHRRKHDVTMEGPITRFDEETGTYTKGEKGANHVWHCSLSLHPDEPALSDQVWASITQDFMTEMKLNGGDGADIEWVAVHHGPSKNGGDHIHIAAVLVDSAGHKIYPRADFPRSQQAVNKLEHKYGLAVVESREHGRASIGETPAEQAKATRAGHDLTERAQLEILMRSALAQSQTETEYVQTLRESGVLVRPRYDSGGMNNIIGYSVALKHSYESGKPAWFGAGRVARDLTLTRIRDSLHDTPEERGHALNVWPTQAQRQAAGIPSTSHQAWHDLAQAIDQTVTALDQIDPNDHAGLAQASQDAAGLLAYYAAAYGRQGTGFARAARAVGRGAQTKHRRSPSRYRPNPLLKAALRRTRGTRPPSDAFMASKKMIASLVRLYRVSGQTVTARRLHADTQSSFATVVTVQAQQRQKKLGITEPPRPGTERRPTPSPFGGPYRPPRLPRQGPRL